MNKGKYVYDYPHAAITADCVVFGFDGKSLHILLVQRNGNPYKDMWALPGGFLDVFKDNTIEDCAKRELEEETNATDIYLQQFQVFSQADRDPRERVLTVAFLALVRKDDCDIHSGTDASDAKWFAIDGMPELAFDHKDIIAAARLRLQEKLRTEPIAFRLLNKLFIMSELQTLYEVIFETEYDRRNFAKKMVATNMFICHGLAEEANHNKKPNLYEFDATKYSAYISTSNKRKYLFDF